MVELGYAKIVGLAIVAIFGNSMVLASDGWPIDQMPTDRPDSALIEETLPQTEPTLYAQREILPVQIDPLSPFGIELGAPFPDNITYRDKTEAFDLITYNFVNVPEPHAYFPRPPRNFYVVRVSALTGEVLSVTAMSTPEQYRSPATTCGQGHTLHDQIRDGAGLISIPKPGRPAGWHGSDGETYWEANLVDSIDQDEIINRVEVGMTCSTRTRKLFISFVDHAASRRHYSAR